MLGLGYRGLRQSPKLPKVNLFEDFWANSWRSFQSQAPGLCGVETLHTADCRMRVYRDED